MASSESFPKGKSDSEWRAVLNKEQFRVSVYLVCPLIITYLNAQLDP